MNGQNPCTIWFRLRYSTTTSWSSPLSNMFKCRARFNFEVRNFPKSTDCFKSFVPFFPSLAGRRRFCRGWRVVWELFSVSLLREQCPQPTNSWSLGEKRWQGCDSCDPIEDPWPFTPRLIIKGLVAPTLLPQRMRLLLFSVCEQRLLSPSSSLLSCPALPPFCFHSCDWLVSLGLSLLLLSHSGASVVAVENGYPCFFFWFYPD